MIEISPYDVIREEDIRSFSFSWPGSTFDPLNIYVTVGFRDGNYSDRISINEEKMNELKTLKL